VKSALAPPPFRPGRALPLSLCIHVGMLAVLALFGSRGPRAETLIRPDQVMQVSLVSLPKQTTRLPQKVMQRADPPPSQAAEPAPAPPDAPPATEMALKKEQPVKPAVEKPDRSAARDKLLREMRRQQALESLAAEGPRDQPQTDPDGEDGVPGSARGVAGDPRLVAFQEQVRQAAMAHFSALQTEARAAVIQVTIDARGNILNSGLAQSSGDPSFDAAARTAVRRTGRVPPPPEELMPGPTATFFIRLSNSD
jgi:protein TonB